VTKLVSGGPFSAGPDIHSRREPVLGVDAVKEHFLLHSFYCLRLVRLARRPQRQAPRIAKAN